MPLALYLLALAVFAMGTSEFMLAGLLPDIASDLDVTVGSAGALTSAFALGMVVGAPFVAAFARDWPWRSGLLGFTVVFAAAHAVGAVTTSFPVLLATRAVAALANAGFLALALTVAASMVPPDRKGRALAVLLSGTTAAMIAGVPGGAVLGTAHGWRATFWAVAALCLPAALGILKGVPAGGTTRRAAGGPRRTETPLRKEPALPTQPALPGERPSRTQLPLRAELAQLTRPRLLLTMLLGALVNGATFGNLTYLAPVVTDTAGLSASWIPVALVLFGAGALIGVTVAGRLSDRRPGLVIAVGGPLLLIGWPTLALLAEEPIALFTLLFLQGALSFALGSTLITRVLYEAGGAPTLAGSFATAALNIGAAVGPLVAATTLTTTAGASGPQWAGGVLVAVALTLAFRFRTVVAAGPSVEAEITARTPLRTSGTDMTTSPASVRLDPSPAAHPQHTHELPDGRDLEQYSPSDEPA